MVKYTKFISSAQLSGAGYVYGFVPPISTALHFVKTAPPLPINSNFEPMCLKEAGSGKRREKQLWTEVRAQAKARLEVGRSRGSEGNRSRLWRPGSVLYVLGSPEGSKQSSDPYPVPTLCVSCSFVS